MNRIEEKMAALKAEGRKAFITYTTAGLPDMDTTAKIMHAQQEAGIDVMELGVLFQIQLQTDQLYRMLHMKLYKTELLLQRFLNL